MIRSCLGKQKKMFFFNGHAIKEVGLVKGRPLRIFFSGGS